jgi:predicted transcriptional regulator
MHTAYVNLWQATAVIAWSVTPPLPGTPAKPRTAHYPMKEAIECYFQAEEAKQAIVQSMDDAIARFEATGLHLTHTEVKAWAQELKANR